jgi:hypothetical protein
MSTANQPAQILGLPNNLGYIIQTAFSNGIRRQISQAHPEWEMINRYKIGNTLARELKFMFQNSYGPAAAQFVAVGQSNRQFPAAQAIAVAEYVAQLKELDVTIEIDYNLWDRANSTPEKYGDYFATELDSKMTAAKRLVAGFLYGDGSGVVATINGAPTETVTSTAGTDKIVVVISEATASKGSLGQCQYGDLLKAKTTAAVAHDATPSAGTFYAWKVIARSRKNLTVTLQPVDADGAALGISASAVASGDVLYRVGQATIPDLTAAVTDWGSLTQVFPGLETLTANDGRVVHGITMTGASAGTVVDGAAGTLDFGMIYELMDEVRVNVGAEYKYKSLVMAPEAQRSFVLSRETDRMFTMSQDGQRGPTGGMKFSHGNDNLDIVTSEFIKRQRIFALPETAGGEKVLEYWGTDFAPIRAKNGDEFLLKPHTSGGYSNMMVSYMRAYQTLICKMPAAIGRLENFTLA